MTKEQAETKLALLPLLTTVDVSYGEPSDPGLIFHYINIPGPGETTIQIDLAPSETQLGDLVNNLPIAPANRLAALAIMLVPPLP